MREEYKKTYDKLKAELEQIKGYQNRLPKLLIQFNEDMGLMKADMLNSLYDFYVLDNEEEWETIEMLRMRFDQMVTLLKNQIPLEQKIDSQIATLESQMHNLKPHLALHTNQIPKYWMDKYEGVVADMKTATLEDFEKKAVAMRQGATDTNENKGSDTETIINVSWQEFENK